VIELAAVSCSGGAFNSCFACDLSLPLLLLLLLLLLLPDGHRRQPA
jgi:hypothetical protein